MFEKFSCGFSIDIGNDKEKQEDYCAYVEFDDGSLFAIVADGTGSREHYLQPALIIANDICANVSDVMDNNRENFLNNTEYYLKRFMELANNVMGAFKVANEEMFHGYAASVTCVYFSADGKYTTAHAGNTREYIIRNGHLTQLTKDHTTATELLENGTIDPDTYHVHPGRLQLTSGIGLVLNPRIDIFQGKLKENDVILLTTDGIHYAITPENICMLVLEAGEPISSSQTLIEAAKDIIKYPDNMTALVVTGILER